MMNGVTSVNLTQPTQNHLLERGDAELVAFLEHKSADVPVKPVLETLDVEKENEEQTKQEKELFRPEDMLLKLEEVPLEVRLKQVVSLEVIQTLLLMRSPFENADHSEDSQYAQPKGMRVDRRS